MADEHEEALQWLLDRCARQFVEQGTWPGTSQVVRDAAREDIELDGFFYAPTPREFLFRRDHNGVVLSALGLARTELAEPLLDALVRFVRLCTELYLGDDDQPKVTADMLRDNLGMDEATIDRIYRLFTGTEYFLTASGGGQDSTNWSFELNDLVRKFRWVESLEQYLTVRHSILSPQQPLPAAVLPAEFLTEEAELGYVELEQAEGTSEMNKTSAPSDSLVAFVSWAHDDEKWDASVREFTDLLRAEGIEAHVDLYDRHKGVDWQLYGSKWIERADFVLIVMSAAYQERWAMESAVGTGAGVAREAVTLRHLFDDDRDKFLRTVRVVLLPGVEPATIPSDISHLSWIRVPELTSDGVDDVVRHMTGEGAYPMPELGPRKKRGPKAPPAKKAPAVPTTEPQATRPGPASSPPDSAEVTIGELDLDTIDTGGVAGLIELRVNLLGKVTPNWVRCFSTVSSSKEGSFKLVLSEPNIRDGKVIWRVEEQDLDSAMRHIGRRVKAANMLLAQERVKQAENEAQARAEEERKRSRLEELRRKVRGK